MAGEKSCFGDPSGIQWEKNGYFVGERGLLGRKCHILGSEVVFCGSRGIVLWEAMSYSGERMVVLRRECCVFEREVLFLGRKCSSIWGRKLLFSGRSVLFWGEKGHFGEEISCFRSKHLGEDMSCLGEKWSSGGKTV